MDELEQAHADYEERKERLLDNLSVMYSNLNGDKSLFKYVSKNYMYWLKQAIIFIKEKEI